MADHPGIEELLARLELLSRKQEIFTKEIQELKEQVFQLKNTPAEEKFSKISLAETSQIQEKSAPAFSAGIPNLLKSPVLPKKKLDLEKFIGENLINKIGIIITVLGVAIGAKYSIDNDLINPLSRILLGYFAGIILLIFGIRFRKNYENYSAVLVSGAIAIMYFITYAAYSFYSLFPLSIAFVLMFIFTALSVIAALKYNRQVIAHIGMVGAYAIPFLLGESPGRADILFTYITIINLGILFIALKRYWKALFYASFSLTWLIFIAWLFTDASSEHPVLALIFASISFASFYFTILGYKVFHKEKYNSGDIVLMLFNSFIYFGAGYFILSENNSFGNLTGLFTLVNAGFHAGVGIFLYRQQQVDRNLVWLITGLGVTYFTIAIPVQLDANWVTLLWAAEATVLFWIGRRRKAGIYEKISYVVMLLAFINIQEDWADNYGLQHPFEESSKIPLFLNIGFLTSILFIAAFGFISYLYNRTTSNIFPVALEGLNKLIAYIIPGILLYSIYYAFQVEIDTYWQQLYLNSAVEHIPADGFPVVYYDHNLISFKYVWKINYTLAFLTCLAILNYIKLKSRNFGIVLLILGFISVFMFLTQGLISLEDLRQYHVKPLMEKYYTTNSFYVWIRYISIAFAAFFLVVLNRLVRSKFMGGKFIVAFDLFLHLSILSIVSSELYVWSSGGTPGNLFKLGLSILWGIYALFLIILGIRKNKRHHRLAAIVLFAITLVKLFLYDISELDTISKTVVFVCLGVLLLVISFLYNRYKNRISI